MRLIGTLEDETQAGRLADYLLSQGMPNHLEEGTAGGWQVWIERDDDLDKAAAELAAFKANSADAKYNAAADAAKKIRREREKKSERLRKRYVDVRTSWTGGRGRFPLTAVLLGLCLLGALINQIGKDTESPRVRLLMFAEAKPRTDMKPAEIAEEFRRMNEGKTPRVWTYNVWEHLKHGQVWRLVTPVFLHGGLLHLLFNMSWLVSLGSLIESRKGTWFMLGLFLVSAIGSNFAQYYWEGPNFVGFSGVVYGLFGYVWLKGRLDPTDGIGIAKESAVIMIGWMILCMVVPSLNVANAAHVGGLLIGCAIGAWPWIKSRLGRA